MKSWKVKKRHREVSELYFVLDYYCWFGDLKKYLYIYTPSWEMFIEIQYILNLSSVPCKLLIHIQSICIITWQWDKAYVTEKYWKQPCDLSANYCFIEIRDLHDIINSLISRYVFSQMCAPIYPSPWLQRETSHHPKSFSLVSLSVFSILLLAYLLYLISNFHYRSSLTFSLHFFT